MQNMPVIDRRNPKTRKEETRFNQGYQPYNSNNSPEDDGPSGENGRTVRSIKRTRYGVYSSVCKQFKEQTGTLPTELQPAKEEENKAEPLAPEESTENIIINFSKLKQFIKLSMAHMWKYCSVEAFVYTLRHVVANAVSQQSQINCIRNANRRGHMVRLLDVSTRHSLFQHSNVKLEPLMFSSCCPA